MVRVKMSSKVYGTEYFTYDTEGEAKAGVKRLKAEAAKLHDGIKRKITIVRKKD